MHSQKKLESKEREFTFSDTQFRYLAGLASKRTGIVLAEHKKDMVYSRLVRRLRVLKLQGFDEYCQLLQGEQVDEEIGHLVNAITTNLTSFFREKHHFEHLHDAVLVPLVTAAPAEKRLRIWSAGCSRGMEPYSIAMMVNAAIKKSNNWDAKILATDIDTNMLDIGKCGEYPIEQYENIPSSCREYVEVDKKNGTMHMKDSLKSQISFKPLNLLEHWPMKGSFDAIFCRNVVIYFDKPTQTKLFNRMADLLKPEGWLYIGHSENLFKVCDRFELTGRTIYRRKY